jgi:hypothetical protein
VLSTIMMCFADSIANLSALVAQARSFITRSLLLFQAASITLLVVERGRQDGTSSESRRVGWLVAAGCLLIIRQHHVDSRTTAIMINSRASSISNPVTKLSRIGRPA